MADLFFMGTGQHRESYEGLISLFSRWIPSEHKRLFDGVASRASSASSPDPMPGTYTYNPDTDTKTRVKHSHLQQLHTTYQRITGSIAGDGVEDLLLEAMQYIEHIKSEGGDLSTINLYGFSRGADTAVRLSNILNILYPDSIINMFIIDHVPGPGNRDDHASYTIPSNVGEFMAILMLDETTPCFSPQHHARYVFNGHQTIVNYRLYRGVHGQAMKASDHPIPMHLAYDDLLHFCLRRGFLGVDDAFDDALWPSYPPRQFTTEDHGPNIGPLSDEQRLRYYHTMLAFKGEYGEHFPFNFFDPLTYRGFVDKAGRRDYVLDPEFFLDKNHRKLFSQQYPALFDWLFKKGLDFGDRAQAALELQSLRKEDINGFKYLTRLHHLGFTKKNHSYILPNKAKGNTGLEEKENQTLIHDQLSYLRHMMYYLANYHKKHRRSQYSENIRHVAKYLLNHLDISRQSTLDPATEIIRLDNVLMRARRYLAAQAPKHFLLKQLSQLTPNYEKFAEKLKALLGKLLKNVAHASEALFDQITAFIQKVNTILCDTWSTAQNKFNHLRTIIQSVYDTVRTHHESNRDSLTTTKSTSPRKLFTQLEKLIVRTDNSLLSSMLHELDHHAAELRVRQGINQLTSDVGISDIDKHLKCKIDIVEQLVADLKALRDTNQENDREAITALLANARSKNSRAYTGANFLNCSLDILLSTLEHWASILRPKMLGEDLQAANTLGQYDTVFEESSPQASL